MRIRVMGLGLMSWVLGCGVLATSYDGDNQDATLVGKQQSLRCEALEEVDDVETDLELPEQCLVKGTEAVAIRTLRQLHSQQQACIQATGALCAFNQLTAFASSSTSRLDRLGIGPGGGCVTSTGPGGGCISIGPGGGCESIGPGGGCLVASGAQKAGYRFSFRVLPPLHPQEPFRWEADAYPIVYQRTGIRSFYVDETGIILGSDVGADGGTNQMPEI